MKPFAFVGKIPASKSMLNRLLLVQSYFGELHVRGESDADDVVKMRAAIVALEKGEVMDAGSAGTVLRFMALRASRIPGVHVIRGSRRLLERAPDELVRVLRQLGVDAQINDDSLRLEGAGWKVQGDTLLVPSHRSSQFVTSVLLNAWNLPFDLYVSPSGQRVSEGYFRMSVQMAQKLGMKIDFWDADFRVPRGQKLLTEEFEAEIDMSSAFTLAALAAVGGQATFLNFPEVSLQPDAAFVTILQRMGVPLQQTAQQLKVEKAPHLNGVVVNLKSTPDLFPVLAALCSLAEGESELFGAPQLALKESNRIHKVSELLRAVGRDIEVREDGIKILATRQPPPQSNVIFDCDQDHRMAFAAAVLKMGGYGIDIQNSEVVSKSFPRFWSILGWAH